MSELAFSIWRMNWPLIGCVLASFAIMFFAIWGLVDFLTWLL